MDEAEPPPATQGSIEPPAKIFIDSNGVALSVFVEASDLFGRPKLIRTLKKYGAIISHQPRDAQIILIDPRTDSGAAFLTDWGSEKGQVVLNYVWVTKSIERGRVFGWDEDWGDCRLLGGSQSPEADTAQADKSPLPTPRPTPIPRSQPLASTSVPSPSQANDAPQVRSRRSSDATGEISTNQTVTLAIPLNLVSTVQGLLNNPSALSQLSSQTVPFATPQYKSPYPGTFPSMSQSQSRREEPSSPTSASPSPSLKRKSLSSSQSRRKEPSGRETKGSTSSQRPTKKPRHDSPSDASSDQDEWEEEGSEQSDNNSDSEESQPELAGIPRPPGEIFKDEDTGEGYKFYVQVDLRGRKDIVSAIRRNCGLIVADVSNSDYTVLATTSTSFPFLYKSTLTGRKPAVVPAFVHQCIQEGKLLDERPFLIDVKSSKVKRARGRPPISPFGIKTGLVKPNPKDSQSSQNLPANTPKSKVSKQPQVKPASKAAKPSSAIGRTPSPPPAATVKRISEGKNYYTPEDGKFFLEYTEVLLRRDPDISATKIAKHMSEKAPHHPAGSWLSYTGKQKEQIDNLRKKAQIARRIANGVTASAPTPSLQDSSPSQATAAKAAKATMAASPESVLPTPPTSDKSADLRKLREFNDIVKFLADGGANDRTDDEVWIVLSNEHPYFSDSEWRKFWENNGLAINTAVQAAVPILNDESSDASEANEPS